MINLHQPELCPLPAYTNLGLYPPLSLSMMDVQQSREGYLELDTTLRRIQEVRRTFLLPVFDFESWQRETETQAYISLLTKTSAISFINAGHICLHPLLWFDLWLAAVPQRKVDIYQWMMSLTTLPRETSDVAYIE